MHGRGFVHLDVKPRNVVMSARPRLIDLSVSMPVDDVRAITRPTGTDAYMAPEQCEPDRFSEIGPASDIWGLGVTLYEAMTRVRPFPAADTATSATGPARYPQLDADPYPLPSDFPRPLTDAILSCLERDPAARPTAAELAQAFEPWVASLPAPRLGLFRPGGRSRRSDFASRDESILSPASPRSHRGRLLLSGMRESRKQEGGAR
jgi:serine/threonine protein kinase